LSAYSPRVGAYLGGGVSVAHGSDGGGGRAVGRRATGGFFNTKRGRQARNTSRPPIPPNLCEYIQSTAKTNRPGSSPPPPPLTSESPSCPPTLFQNPVVQYSPIPPFPHQRYHHLGSPLLPHRRSPRDGGRALGAASTIPSLLYRCPSMGCRRLAWLSAAGPPAPGAESPTQCSGALRRPGNRVVLYIGPHRRASSF